MANVNADNFGGQPNPAEEAVALDRLKYMIGLLPGGSPFGPDPSANQAAPPEDPKVLDLVQWRFQAARRQIAIRFEMLDALYDGLKAVGLPPSDTFKIAYLQLADDVIRLQMSLRTPDQTS